MITPPVSVKMGIFTFCGSVARNVSPVNSIFEVIGAILVPPTSKRAKQKP
jgi:hypothetical protein